MKRLRMLLGEDPSVRAVACLVGGFAVALLVGFALSSDGDQVFASFGLAKRIVMPVLYLFVVTALLVPYSRRVVVPPVPRWCFVVTAGLSVGVIFDFTSGTSPQLGALLQGAALFLGWVAFCLLGLHCDRWPKRVENFFLAALIVGAILSGALTTGAAPFVALSAPAAWLAFYVALKRRSLVYFLGGLIALAVTLIPVVDDPNASVATMGQSVVAAGLLLLFVIPRSVRIPVAVFGAGLAVLLVLTSDLPALMSGNWQHETDVTLAQRGFETAAVVDQISMSPWTLLFGLGPAGTVDLTMAPDAGTLLAAGRYLPAVDGVHLLSTWALFKGGLVGLIWLVLFLGSAVHQLSLSLLEREPSELEVALLLLLFAGIVMALPAATHLFVNPLPAFSLGALIAYRASAAPESRDVHSVAH